MIATSFHEVTQSYYYVQGTFKTEKAFDIEWAGQPLWGFNNAHTIFGSDPIEAIPVLNRTAGSKREHEKATGDGACRLPCA